MKKKIKHPLLFIVGLVALMIIVEVILSVTNPVAKYNVFVKNDYEKIVAQYSDDTFDKAIYGNSAVIASFIDTQSKSGYTNIGIDYGTIEDLYAMLDQGLLNVESDLVIGLNYFTLMDTLDTNPTYPWHKKFYEPYLYFNRDRINPVITEGIKNVLNGDKFVSKRYESLDRTVYRGSLNAEELSEREAVHEKLYWNLGIEHFDDNLKALEKVVKFAEDNNIRLRCILLPWNDVIEKPSSALLAENGALEILNAHSVEVLDLSYTMPSEYFHDLGHLNYEQGAVKFTEEIDEWLMEN